MKIHGHCHCGSITYRATLDPERIVVCHCTDCQSLSGSAFRTIAFTQPDAFEVLTGTIKVYVKTTANSGNPRAQGFCGDCGSGIYATSVGDGPKVYGLRTGTITQRADLIPNKQVWHSSALPWLNELGSLPASEKQA
jgi:hypothetical protein